MNMSNVKKPVILTIDNVRIIRDNPLNVAVERLEDVYFAREGTTTKKWRFKGFANSILSALHFIQHKELLIDYNAVTDLKSYLKLVEESNKKLIDKLEVIK